MQTWTWTELLQVLEVTTTGNHSHVDSQALGEVRHTTILVAALPRWPAGQLLMSHIRLRLEFMVLFKHSAPDMIVQLIENLESLGPFILLSST